MCVITANAMVKNTRLMLKINMTMMIVNLQ